jgi:hypothetical protein
MLGPSEKPDGYDGTLTLNQGFKGYRVPPCDNPFLRLSLDIFFDSIVAGLLFWIDQSTTANANQQRRRQRRIIIVLSRIE